MTLVYIQATTVLSNQGTLDEERKQINEETHRDESKGEAEGEMDEQREEEEKEGGGWINETSSAASKGAER